MVRDEIENLSHGVRMQLGDPRIIFSARTNRRVQLVVISDVIAVETIGAGLKIRRRINVTYAERMQVRHDFACLRKREPAIELQSIGAGWDARMFLCHSRKQTSNAQRPTSNAEIILLLGRWAFDVRRWGFSYILLWEPAKKSGVLIFPKNC